MQKIGGFALPWQVLPWQGSMNSIHWIFFSIGCRQSCVTMAARRSEEALLFQHLGYRFDYRGGATPKASPTLGPGSLEGNWR